MIPFFTEKYGNASSMHTFGGQVGKSIQDAREKVAAMLGAQPEEIVFTSCGTESDSTAVMSALQAQPEKKHVITTRVEHSALIALGQHLEQKGYELTYLAWTPKGAWIWTNCRTLCAKIRPLSPSCSPTMRPVLFFRFRRSLKW